MGRLIDVNSSKILYRAEEKCIVTLDVQVNGYGRFLSFQSKGGNLLRFFHKVFQFVVFSEIIWWHPNPYLKASLDFVPRTVH